MTDFISQLWRKREDTADVILMSLLVLDLLSPQLRSTLPTPALCPRHTSTHRPALSPHPCPPHTSLSPSPHRSVPYASSTRNQHPRTLFPCHSPTSYPRGWERHATLHRHSCLSMSGISHMLPTLTVDKFITKFPYLISSMSWPLIASHL